MTLSSSSARKRHRNVSGYQSGHESTGIDQCIANKVLRSTRAIEKSGLNFADFTTTTSNMAICLSRKNPSRTSWLRQPLPEIAGDVMQRHGCSGDYQAGDINVSVFAQADGNFHRGNFVHRVSPGTVIYCNAMQPAAASRGIRLPAGCAGADPSG